MDGGRDIRKGRRLEDERQQAGVSDIRPVKVLYSKEDVRGTTEISPRQPQSTSMGPRPAMMPQEPSMPYRKSLPRHDPQSDFWTQNLKPAPDIRAEQLQAEFLSPSRSDLLQGQTVTPYQRRGYPIDVAASQPGYEYQDYNRQAPPLYGQMRQPVRSNYQTYQGPNLQFAPAYQQYDRPYYAVHRYENEFMNPPLWNGPPANPPAFPRDTPPPLYNTSHDYFHSGRSTLPRRMQQGGAFPGYTTPPAYNMHTAQSNMSLYQDQGYSPQNYMVNQSGRTSQESLSGPTTKSTDSSSGSANTLHLYDISELPPKMRVEAGNVSTIFPKTAPGQVASGADNGHHQTVVVASTRKDLSKALDEVRQQSVKNQDLHGPEIQHQSVKAVVKTAQEVSPHGSDDLDRAALLLQEAIMDAGIDEIDGVFIKRNSHLVPQDNDQDDEATQPMDNHVVEEEVRSDKGDAIQLEAHAVNLSTRGSFDPLSNCYQHESDEGNGSGAKGTDVKSIAVSAVLTKNTLSESSESSCDGAQSFMSCTEQDNIIKSLIHCCTDFDQSTETKQNDADNVCRQPPSVEHTLDQEIAEFMGNSTCQMYTEGQAGTSAGGTGVVTGRSEGKTTGLTTFIDGESQDPRQTFGSMGSDVLHPSSTLDDGGGALWYPYCETDVGCVDYLNSNMLPFGPHTAQFVPGPDATFSAMDWRRSFCGMNPTQGFAPSGRPGVNDYSVYAMSQSRQAVDMPFFQNWDLWSPDARTMGRQVEGFGHVTQATNQYTNMADILPCPTTEMGQAQGFPVISFADFISESTQDVTATVISSDPTQSETNLAYMWQLAAEGFETPSNSCKEVKGETIHDSSDCGGSEVLVNGNVYSGQTGQSGVRTGRDSHETRDELTTDQLGPSSGTPCEDVSARVDDSSTPPSNLNCEVSSTCSPDEASRCVESNLSRVPLCPDSQPVPGSMSPPVYTRHTEGEALDELNTYLASLLEGGGSRTEQQ